MSPRRWPTNGLHCYANQMLKRIFVGIGVFVIASAAFAQAYRWVDENGIVHFSDRPMPGAERIELPSSNSSNSARRPTSRPAARSATAAEEEPAEDDGPFAYESIEVASPVAEETLWNIGGILNASVDLQPALQPGHQIRVFFDGEERMTVQSTSFQIDEVWRGSHNLQVEVLDQAGNAMIRSYPNRFYVQQTRVN